jgi:hypothetical protein
MKSVAANVVMFRKGMFYYLYSVPVEFFSLLRTFRKNTGYNTLPFRLAELVFIEVSTATPYQASGSIASVRDQRKPWQVF